MRKNNLITFGFIFFIFSLVKFSFAQDTLTITTYYPSPHGVYKSLRVYPNDDTDPSAACFDKGTMYYDDSESQLYICDGTDWVATGGGGGWTDDGTVVRLTTITDNVGIGTTNPAFKLSLDSDGGILAKGTYNSGATLPAIGQGSILIWYPYKAAFRAGYAGVGTWSDAMTGVWSTAMGYSTIASADASTAMGGLTTASGAYSTAMGANSIASSFASTAMGSYTTASGPYSTAIGRSTTASGTNSIALGLGVGANTLLNNIDDSLMIGFNSDIPTLFVGPSSGIGTVGNVGIGTVNPAEKLDIGAGNIAMGYEKPFNTQAGNTATATCTGTKYVLGGGCSCSGGANYVLGSVWNGDSAWTCICSNGAGAATAYAICAQMR
ncbi:MAG: hypothetical protein ABIH19_04090 [Candidatus Omnitrophota bacterium]